MYAGGFIAGGITYPYELDRERTSQRLSAFLSKIIEKKPVDAYFKKFKAVEALSKNKRKVDGAAPLIFPVHFGESPNSKWANSSDPYEVVNSSGTNSMCTATYFLKDIHDQLVISERELRENNEPRIVDLMSYKHDLIMESALKRITASIFAASQSADQPTALPIGILDSGSCGGVSASSVSQWAAQAVNHSSADFSVGGYQDLLLLINKIVGARGTPDLILTTSALITKMELLFDADVRYSDPSLLDRGAEDGGIRIKKMPAVWDDSATANTVFVISRDKIPMYVDSGADMKFDDLRKREDQHAYGALFLHSLEFPITSRREHGVLQNVV